MPEFRVTTERLVEADSAAEAAALSARIRPDEWVVYSDDYKVVTVVTVAELIEAQNEWFARGEELVDATIIEDTDEPDTPGLSGLPAPTLVFVDEVQDIWPDPVQIDTYPIGRTFDSGDTFSMAEIDPGEYWGQPDA